MVRWGFVVGIVGIAGLMLAACAGTNKYTPEERARIEDHERRAETAFERGKFDEAAEHYDWLINTYPRVVEDHQLAKRTAVYFLRKDYERGLRFATEVALRKFPDSALILEQHSLLLWALARPEEAIAAAERAVSLSVRSYQAQLLLGTYYYERDLPRSMHALIEYLGHRPPALAAKDGIPRVKLGILSLKLHDPFQAVYHFETARKEFPDDPRIAANANNGLCAAYVAAFRYADAIAMCEPIVADRKRLDRKGSALFNLARAYMHEQRWDDALALGRRYFDEYNPNTPQSWLLLADAYLGRGDCADGERALEKAGRRGADATDVAERRPQVDTCTER